MGQGRVMHDLGALAEGLACEVVKFIATGQAERNVHVGE